MRFAFLFLFALILATSSDAVRADPIHDCTGGCYVVTCEGGNCTLWSCDASGCRAVATFQKKQPKALSDAPLAILESETAYVKICPVEKSCNLLELSKGQALDLGTFDNIDSVIEHRKQMRKSKPD